MTEGRGHVRNRLGCHDAKLDLDPEAMEDSPTYPLKGF
jgi:hypothetical protein